MLRLRGGDRLTERAHEVVLPDIAESRRGFGEIIRNSEFRLIWFSQIASQLADKFLVYSLLAVTYQRSGGANTQEAVVLLAYTFPSVLLSPIAGIYADRFDKRRLMMVTNVVRGILILLVPLSSFVGYFQTVTWHLLLITFLFSAVGQFFAPAEASALPFIVKKEGLITATSLFTVTIVGTLVLGLPISSVLVRLFGSTAPYLVAAALFGAAAAANLAMRTRLAATAKVELDHGIPVGKLARIWDEVSETATFVRKRPVLLAAFAQLGLAIMLIFSIFTLSQGYMATVLRLDPRDSYLILGPAALGIGAMAAYLGRGHQGSRGRLLSIGLIGMGGLLLTMGSVPYLLVNAHALVIPFAAIVGSLFGAAFGAVFIPAITLLQESTDEQQRGRIFGAMFTVLNLAIAVPLFLAGLAADTFGLNAVVLLLGVLVLGAGVVAIWPRGRRLKSDGPNTGG